MAWLGVFKNESTALAIVNPILNTANLVFILGLINFLNNNDAATTNPNQALTQKVVDAEHGTSPETTTAKNEVVSAEATTA